MLKKGLTTGWLYLALFILTVAFMLLLVVPEQAWPDKRQVVQKLRLNDIKSLFPKVLLEGRDCDDYSYQKCMESLDECWPRYTYHGMNFLDCRHCPSYPSCYQIREKEACEAGPCGVECQWVVGRFEGGVTELGRCVILDVVEEMKKELKQHGINIQPPFSSITGMNETEQFIFFNNNDDFLVIDKDRHMAFVRLSGVATAYNRDGSVNTSATAGFS